MNVKPENMCVCVSEKTKGVRDGERERALSKQNIVFDVHVFAMYAAVLFLSLHLAFQYFGLK